MSAQDVTEVGGTPVTTIERTIVDVARLADVRGVVAVNSVFVRICIPDDGRRTHREDVEAAQEQLRARLLDRLRTMKG